MRYIPNIVRTLLWEQDIERAATKGYDQHGNFVHADFFTAASEHVKLSASSGVTVLAGTDNIDTYVFTGSSLHDELAMLVDAGLTPLAAIQSATINAAKFAKMEDDFGSVEFNKQADLLLLNSNPFLNIAYTTNIFGVMVAGHYFDQDALEALDRFAIDSAKSIRVNMRYLYNLLASPLMRVQLVD